MHSRIMSDIRTLAALMRPSWTGISEKIAASGVPTMDATTLANGGLKGKLRDTEAQLAEARECKTEANKHAEEAKEAYAASDEKDDDGPLFKAAEAAVAALGDATQAVDGLVGKQEKILRMLGTGGSAKTGHDRAAGIASDPRCWNSEGLFENDELAQEMAQIAESKARQLGNRDLGQVIGRDALAELIGGDLLAADVEPTSQMRRGPLRAIVPQLRRPLRVLDLIPTGTMDNNAFPFVREEGSLTGAAKGVKEGEAKPQGGFEYVDDEAVARTVAEYMKIKKQALSDVSALRSTIDGRLRYALEAKLEAEVLRGKGTDPELKGILHSTGIGVVKWVANQLTADQTLKGITSVFLANAQASGIVMHPNDWMNTLLAKAIFKASAEVEGGSGEYYSGGPFNVTPQVMWGVPLIANAAMKEGEILVGDFGIGVQLLFREGINILFSDSNEDDFTKNRVTILGELRAANVVWRPPAFTKIFLTKAAEEADA